MMTDDECRDLARLEVLRYSHWVRLTGLRMSEGDSAPFWIIDESGIRFRGWPADMLAQAPDDMHIEMAEDHEQALRLRWPCSPADLLEFVEADRFGVLWLPDAFVETVRAEGQTQAQDDSIKETPTDRDENLLRELERWVASGKKVKDFEAAKVSEGKWGGIDNVKRMLKAARARRRKAPKKEELPRTHTAEFLWLARK